MWSGTSAKVGDWVGQPIQSDHHLNFNFENAIDKAPVNMERDLTVKEMKSLKLFKKDIDMLSPT